MHGVIKARSEHGKRLNIRRSTLRAWRQQFAQNLRELGVAANATDRVVRGATRTMPDGLYRAVERGEMIRTPSNATKRSALSVNAATESGALAKTQDTHEDILNGWRNVYAGLCDQGESSLALSVRVFLDHIKRQQELQRSPAHARGQRAPEHARVR